MELSRKQRYEACVDYLSGDETMAQVAKRYGVAQSYMSQMFDPTKKVRHAIYLRDRYAADLPKSRAEQRVKQKKLRATRNRFQLAILDSKGNAQRGGYAPLIATEESLNTSLIEQGFRCMICRAVDGRSVNERLKPDHCHRTGRFRGWLCHRCNTGIHVFEEYPDKTVQYLRE